MKGKREACVTFKAAIRTLATGVKNAQDGSPELVLKVGLEGDPDDVPEALKTLAAYQEEGDVEVTVRLVQSTLPGV